MVLLSAQGMDVRAIAQVAFTSEDRVQDVMCNFNTDGFGSLYTKYEGGHPPKFTLPQRREIKRSPSPSRAIICDNFSPHLSTPKDTRVGTWAASNNVEIAYTSTNSSWVNRGAVHRAAVLRTGRHRPRQPPRTGEHDPPVHHLAQQPRLRRATSPNRRPGKRSLMRY
jgi:hypothetical protein